jgi:hypothetical protein
MDEGRGMMEEGRWLMEEMKPVGGIAPLAGFLFFVISVICGRLMLR